MAKTTKATASAKTKATPVKAAATEEKTTKTVAAKVTAAPAAEEKKTTAKTSAVKAETAKVEKAEKVEEKASAAKKTTTKKAETVEKAPVVTAPAEAKAEVFVEFGNAQVSVDKVIEDVKKTYAANGGTEEIKSVKVYLKPEEHAAYYVINETVENRMDVYFF